MDPRPSEQLANLFGGDRLINNRPCLSYGDLARNLARDSAELSLELADPALASVAGHDAHHRIVREVDSLSTQSRFLELSRNQILLGDLGLLLFCVSGEVHDFHSVEQRSRNVLNEIARGDEQNFAQVERNSEIVIGERVVLRGIEDLEQRG